MNKITKTIILKEGDPEDKKAEILQYFYDSFDIDTHQIKLTRKSENRYNL